MDNGVSFFGFLSLNEYVAAKKAIVKVDVNMTKIERTLENTKWLLLLHNGYYFFGFVSLNEILLQK